MRKTPLKELLSKIKWSESENPEDYSIVLLDLGKLREVPYSAIKRTEGNFLVLELEGKETEVPMHRVKRLKKRGVVIWARY